MKDRPQIDGSFLEESEEDDERDVEFWEVLMDQGEKSLERGHEEIRGMRSRNIEMIKIVLLLGTLYVALFRLGPSESVFQSVGYIIFLPFVFLLIAFVIFVYSYVSLGGQVLGPGVGNVREAVSDDLSVKEYKETMSKVYFLWSDENIEMIKRSSVILVSGIIFILASLGAISAIFVLS